MPKRMLAIAASGALVLVATVAINVRAQPATGTVTGRVMWGACIRGIPLPATADGSQDQPAPGVPIRPVPVPPNGLPAGAVLVAVQNTAISARTDESGRFTLSGVPAGQYLSVAAGPVANQVVAVAQRPNVFVDGGATQDIGTLSLGGATPCRFPLGVPDGSAAPSDAPTPTEGP